MRLVVCILAFLIFFQGAAFALWFKKKYDKEEEEKKPMVQTVDEWMESATSLKMDMRKREEDKEQKDDKIIPPADKPLYIVPYNVKAGSRELDLSRLSKTENVRSVFVADPDFDKAVYSEVYYYPQTEQIAATLYMIELDGHLGKKERLADVSIFEHTRYPLISTALPYLRDGFFSTLTLVDYSSNGEIIVAKEKRGSRRFGLYETYVWLYFFTGTPREESQCYRNNRDFSNELASYDTLNEGLISNDGSGMGNYDQLNTLSAPPASALTQSGDISKTGAKTGNSGGAGNSGGTWGGEYNLGGLKAPIDLNALQAVPDKNIDMPKLNYKDINSFIQSSWKAQLEEPSATSRWYNTPQVDFFEDDNYNAGKKNPGFGVRLNLLNEMIKAYWFDRRNLILNHIRWDLNPLGFNKDNNEEIIVAAWAYGQKGEQISLGMWAVNINDGLPRLVAADEQIQIEANGFILEAKLNP